MTPTAHILALLCILLMASGQILFKLAADALKAAGTFVDITVLSIAGSALMLYAVATVLWIVLLQNAPLSRAYPYVALSFVLVTAASWWFFRESISTGQIAGLGFIVIGLLVTAMS
jgi:drug/metabolite transporter (DMT)-like permease